MPRKIKDLPEGTTLGGVAYKNPRSNQMAKRELKAGAGYRFLEEDETVLAGDEVRSPLTGRWTKTKSPGTEVRATFLRYRRKVNAHEATKPKITKPEITKPESGQKYLIKVGSSASSTSFSDVTGLTQDYEGGFHILTFRGVSGRDVKVVTRETVVITPVTSV